MHAIEFIDFSTRKQQKTILKECKQIADANGDYPGQIDGIRFRDVVLDSRKEAEDWIDEHDKGWYDNLAIKFKDGKKVLWLVKIEYHC